MSRSLYKLSTISRFQVFGGHTLSPRNFQKLVCQQQCTLATKATKKKKISKKQVVAGEGITNEEVDEKKSEQGQEEEEDNKDEESNEKNELFEKEIEASEAPKQVGHDESPVQHHHQAQSQLIKERLHSRSISENN
ncbi:hypothetical protein RFI_27954 [Reticulomyxa filosa]|uniref:Uncharacterized protein n=1 Tax=Reticulomyxa filosa TaxID=46433 RepID=X6M8T2_RETFI|nr:hypothetical protein RFI_27954 [Reticulomyxa filosa]|eukprot:ETO09425.1 hypothetical protein RFI_27954 [Reticulomyxa filosa]